MDTPVMRTRSTASRSPVLDDLRIAAPCPASWDAMRGSDRVRFCDRCQLHVYDLSEMSRREAERLIEQTKGRVCVRFWRRADGTILTQNCPVGLRWLRRRLAWVIGRAAALLGLTVGVAAAGGCRTMGPPVRSMGRPAASAPAAQPATGAPESAGEQH